MLFAVTEQPSLVPPQVFLVQYRHMQDRNTARENMGKHIGWIVPLLVAICTIVICTQL